MRFFHEKRPAVPEVIMQLASEREETAPRPRGRVPWQIVDVAILAEDGAPCGRPQCLRAKCTIGLSAEGLHKRCGRRHGNVAMHGLSNNKAALSSCHETLRLVCICWWPKVTKPSQPSSRCPATAAAGCTDFTGQTETDEFAKALKLWVVQLSEKGGAGAANNVSGVGLTGGGLPGLAFPGGDTRAAPTSLNVRTS